MKHLTPKERERPCETCGKVFCPRMTQLREGGGRFCSQKCNTAGVTALRASEAKKVAAIRAARAAGKWTVLSGPQNGMWKGGNVVAKRRWIESGKANDHLRRYRASNPEKAREWAQNRRNKTRGKLPDGTISKVGAAQRWRCAICSINIRNAYHVDHIMPIAKGGQHKPSNIQLLCAPCNVRKWAKDPIDHMQELGRLL